MNKFPHMFSKRVTLSEGPIFLPDKMKSRSSHSHNRVSWRASTESLISAAESEDGKDVPGEPEPEGGDRRKSSLSSPFQTSQWPAQDPLISKRRSSLRLHKKISTEVAQTSKFWGCFRSCCGMRKREPIYGVIEGPVVKIKQRQTLPIDYFSTYRGKIKPKAVAVIHPLTRAKLTYEDLNLASDELAKLLKPIVEEELANMYSELLEDLSVEPCIGIARNPCEVCVSSILAVWKLGLPYLPIKTYQNPIWRVSAIIHSVKPLFIIGMSFDETLNEAATDKCKVLQFESLWEIVKENMAGKKPMPHAERTKTFRIEKLDEFRVLREELDPSQRCVSITHRFNGEGSVIATYTRTITVWNRLHAEWSRFPYTKNETVAVHSSVDSHEFLAQFLAPLLGGRTAVFVDAHDVCGFLECIQKFKLRRLTLFPELLYAMTSVMEMTNLLKNSGMSTSQYASKLNFFDTVKYWFCTGAAIRNEQGISFFANAPKNAQLVNLFGCRELLAFVCVDVFKSAKDFKNGNVFEIIPMGKPVMNTRLYVLDQNDQITEGSDLGEIYLAAHAITNNPYHTNSQVGSFSQQKGGTFELFTVPNPFIEGEKNQTKKAMYQALLKTRDFGKLAYSEKESKRCDCGKNQITLQFSGNCEGEMTIENYRVNTNEIYTYVMQLEGVKNCHIMLYRPGTPSKALLAFISISHRHPISKEDIHVYLRSKIPEYFIPDFVIVPAIPLKNYRVDTATLVGTYLKDRVYKKDLNWAEVLNKDIEKDYQEIKATKSLCRILYYSCGVALEWAAHHLDWTLAELRIPFTSTPGIYRELLRGGYNIEMKQFFAATKVYEILQLMLKNSPAPLPEIALRLIERSHLYGTEVITNKHKNEIIKFFVHMNSCGVAHKRTLVQYCALSNKDLYNIIIGIWPLIVYRSYSITVRDRSTNQLVAALLNSDVRDKTYCQQWQVVAQQHPSKYRVGIIDQVDESLAKKGLINPRFSLTGMGSLFFMYDILLVSNFEKSIQVLELLFTQAIQVAKSAGFDSIHVTIYDYIFVEFLVEAFNFEIIEYKQANLYTARDGTKPFHLAPDHITGTVLYKKL